MRELTQESIKPSYAIVAWVILAQVATSTADADSIHQGPWQPAESGVTTLSGVTYRIIGQRASIPYSVVIQDLDHPTRPSVSCAAPCTRRLDPGPVRLTVTGPGSSRFESELVLPELPAEIRVQHFTSSRLIAGSILTALGLALSISSSIGMTSYATGWRIQDVPESLLGGTRFPLLLLSSLGLAHGAVCLFTGVGLLAATRRSSVSTKPITGIPSIPGKIQFSSLHFGYQPQSSAVSGSATLRF